MVGVEPELRKVGDYFTTHISGTFFDVPVVVVRDEELNLRAFINVCRHRADFVATGLPAECAAPSGGRAAALRDARPLSAAHQSGTLAGLPLVRRDDPAAVPPPRALGPVEVDAAKPAVDAVQPDRVLLAGDDGRARRGERKPVVLLQERRPLRQ